MGIVMFVQAFFYIENHADLVKLPKRGEKFTLNFINIKHANDFNFTAFLFNPKYEMTTFSIGKGGYGFIGILGNGTLRFLELDIPPLVSLQEFNELFLIHGILQHATCLTKRSARAQDSHTYSNTMRTFPSSLPSGEFPGLGAFLEAFPGFQEVFSAFLVTLKGHAEAFDGLPAFVFQLLVDDKRHLVLRHDVLRSGHAMRFSMRVSITMRIEWTAMRFSMRNHRAYA